MRSLVFLCLTFATLPLNAAERCMMIHGRAHYYGGDANLRVWHIGTHHDFWPDDSSWDRVLGWLDAGVKEHEQSSSASTSSVYLFADFRVCPVEPYKKGSVQRAMIKSAEHRHYVAVE